MDHPWIDGPPEWNDVTTDWANWTGDALGIIGDSADKRFTFVRLDRKTNDPKRPEHFYIIDWREGGFRFSDPPQYTAADRVAKEWKSQGPSPGLGHI